MHWSQVYKIHDSTALAVMCASIPVLIMLGGLGLLQLRAHVAAFYSLAAALLIATAIWGMPASLALSAAALGALFGLFPIGWLILNALFIYEISEQTGNFRILQAQIARLSSDRRIQVILIAFAFGAFVEGAAGFGAPVAITSALLVGLSFSPLDAAKLALIGNTAPVAFGSLGIPVVTLAKVTGLDLQALTSMVGRQLPVFSALIPFWLVAVFDGKRGLRAAWPACLVTGGAFALTQFSVSEAEGPWLVDFASSIAAVCALLLLLKFWQPAGSPPRSSRNYQAGEWKAWVPWALLCLAVFLWSFAPWKIFLDHWFTFSFPLRPLHFAVSRMPPVSARPEAEAAEFTFNILSATGSALLFAGIISGLILRVKLSELARIYFRTLYRLRYSLATIMLMLALGYTTRYAGLDTTLGLALAGTGMLFPFFSPLIGWLGVALTGSDTSSNVLFGNLQKVTAQQLGLSPVLTAAANSSGGVMGKMIDAQSIVVAGTAGGLNSATQPVRAGDILRAVFPHSLALALLMGLWILLLNHLGIGAAPR